MPCQKDPVHVSHRHSKQDCGCGRAFFCVWWDFQFSSARRMSRVNYLSSVWSNANLHHGFVKIRGGSALSTTSGINVISTLFIANYISRILFQCQLSVNVELFGGFSVENPRDKVELTRVSLSCACHHAVWRVLSDAGTELLRCCEPLVTHHLRLIKLYHRAEKISSNFTSVLNLLSLDIVIVTLFKLNWLPSHIIPPKNSKLRLIGV